MQVITTVGLDIAKSVFQVHGIDVHGSVVLRRQLKRRYVLAFFRKHARWATAHDREIRCKVRRGETTKCEAEATPAL